MAALRDELITAVQSIRAFLIRKVWSASSVEKNNQTLESFDVNLLHQLIREDVAHHDVWKYFLSLYNIKELTPFNHHDLENINTLNQYLKEIENGHFPAVESFIAIFKKLNIEITEDEHISLNNDAIDAPKVSTESTNAEHISDAEVDQLPIDPIQKLTLEINSIGEITEAAHQIIRPYQEALGKIYDSAPDIQLASTDHDKLISIIKTVDFYAISAQINNYQSTNDFERDLQERYLALTRKKYHDAIVRLRSTHRNAKFIKDTKDIISAAKSQLLFAIDDALLETLTAFAGNESEEAATKILYALDQAASLLNNTYVTKSAEYNNTANHSAVDVARSQLKHPYYLQGSLEPTMKECPPYDDDLIAELKESFLEESETEIFPLIQTTISRLRTGTYEEADILDLRRAFHTLKGSGYTASLPEIGEIGWQVERVINGVRDNYYPFSEAILYHAIDGYHAISDRINNPNLQNNELQRITYQAQYLIDHNGIVDPADLLPIPSEKTDKSTIKIEPIDFNSFDDIPESFISPYQLRGQDGLSLIEMPLLDDDLVAELKASMLDELSNELLPALNQLSTALLKNTATVQDLNQVQKIFHTLKGSALLVGLSELGEISGTIETLFASIISGAFKLSPVITSHIIDTYIIIKKILNNTPIDEYEFKRLLYQGNQLVENSGNITQLLQEQNKLSNVSAIAQAEETLSERRQAIFKNIQSVIEQSELSSLDQKLTEEKLEITDEELSQQLIASFSKCESKTYSALKRYTQDITLCLLHPNFSQKHPIHHLLITSYQKHLLLFRAHGLTPQDERLILWGQILTIILGIIKTNKVDDAVAYDYIEILQKPILETEGQSKSETGKPSSQKIDTHEEVDPELLQAFFEEAHEVLEQADEIIQLWQEENYNPNSELISELRRQMHTLKGGARMVGKEGLAQLSHALESLLDPNYITLFDSDPKRFEVLQRALDHLQILLESQNTQLDQEGFNLLSALHLLLGHENPSELLPHGENKGVLTTTEVSERTAMAAQAELSTLRITLNQLNSISEKISENNVLTTQYSNSISDIMSTFTELSRTMQYLNMTARNIEIETEAQMISRHAKASKNDEDFDPLELDQFSELQHLARSISESIEDLNEFHKHISNNMESINSSLSKFSGNQIAIADTLTDIGTISFNSIVPRLRRIVRQVSKSNHKEVELITHGIETQVERAVLEQMTAAFDHMIRNSIIHGIESPEERIAIGKPAHGTITLKVAKHGSDLSVELSDDGRGFNVNKIRQKAINEGLIEADALIDDNELVSLTMLPGFTTATQLSQDAGRGVGLDVLTKAMTILKGTANISFVPNAGVTFKISIPSTLMIVQSLIVSAGGQKYAIPIDNIIGVTQEKDVIFDGRRTHFISHNDKYDVYDLDRLYSGIMVNKGKFQNYIYLLFEVNGSAIAVGAESIVSQLEIIMHPLNPQISNIIGLTGSAVTPDGETIFTVDISAFTNSSNKLIHKKEHHEEPVVRGHNKRDHKSTVMVIDDSITMRRVSQRMLERAGYNVITAKDGIDALELLETNQPDLIMLDIEMPRMDGFEVLTYLRSEDKFMKTPVMMVTSRSGEKHRNRAFEIGANEYCGKPYQEEQILQTINNLLNEAQ